MLMNTIAFIILMATRGSYIGTEHKLNGCLYDPNEVWCYTDLHCVDDPSAQYKNTLS